MSKPAKPAAPEEATATGDTPPKSKKMLIIIIAAVVLLVGGGAAAYFLMKPAHPDKHDKAAGEEVSDGADESKSKLPPKFVEIGTFTANLIHEDSDRYLQVAISLKLSNPELEERVKENNPEILHKINMLLQSKRPSELATVEGKEKLANEIKEQIEFVMGLRKTAPVIHTSQPVAEGEVATAQPEPASTPGKKGIAEVLFTSFIIQ
ncbi:MAG: flagellar basal body-associated FliL family protein [Gallionella sp.]|jgi:flagellar FliL protein